MNPDIDLPKETGHDAARRGAVVSRADDHGSDSEDHPDNIAHSYHVPGYKLISKEGEGGMGIVWRAVQLPTQRRVALKVVRSDVMGSHRNLARFEREVRLAACLEHPNIARVYDSGLSLGIYYYAMEFLDGVHLDQFVLERGLSCTQTLRLFVKVCDAVHHAHQRGVLHRDLKPSNILVTPDGEPHIVDFGLAVHAEASDRTEVSMAGDFVGTLPYMSPEQVQGNNRIVDVRSDVYALGVILYELLVGAMPHDDSGSRIDLQNRIISGRIQRALGRSKRVDGELETIMFKAMALAIDQRYGSADQLKTDIQSYLDGAPISVKPLTLGYFVQKWVGRHRLSVAVGAATAVLMCAVIIGSFIKVSNARAEAEYEANVAEHALYLTRIGYAKAELERSNYSKAKSILEAAPQEQRHWEWYYLRRQADSSLWTTYPNIGKIINVQPSSDGILLFAISNRHRFAVLRTHGGGVERELDLEGNNELLRTAGVVNDVVLVGITYSNFICGWNEKSGDRLWSARLPSSPTAVSFSSTKNLFAVVDSKGHVTVYNAENGQQVLTFEVSAPVHAMAFSPDSEYLALAGNGVTILDISADHQVITLSDSDATFSHIEFSADGMSLLASGNVTRIWNTRSWKLQREFAKSEGDYIGEVGFCTPSETLYAIESDQVIRRISEKDQREVELFRGHSDEPIGGEFIPRMSVFISYSSTEIKCWRPNPSVIQVLPTGAAASVSAFAIDKSSRWVASASTGVVYTYDLLTGMNRAIHIGHRTATMIDIDSFGKWVATASEDHCIDIWDIASGDILRNVRCEKEGRLEWVSFADDGRRILIATDRSVFTVSLRTGKRNVIAVGDRLVSAYSRGVNRLVVCESAEMTSRPCRLTIWDLQNHQIVYQALIEESPGRLYVGDNCTDRIAWTVTGNDLAIYDTRRRMISLHLPNVTDSRYAVAALSADASRLITVRSSIQLWDALSGTPLVQLSQPQKGRFWSVIFRGARKGMIIAGGKDVMTWSTGR